MSERQYWLGFNLVKGIGPVRVQNLLEYFGTLGEAWNATSEMLLQAGLDKRSTGNLFQARKNLDLSAEVARLDKLGIAMLTWEDDDYPSLLKQLRSIHHAPPVLYVRGSLTIQDNWALCVVGTRTVSAYGRQVTYQIATELARNRVTIVSGLARGVDVESHEAALAVDGRTLAVLPCGLDTIYPPEHRNIVAKIIQNGAIVSPFPLGTQPVKGNFPYRNQVISGLCRGVLVVEASEKSGALMTAGSALEQGREVFAIPGNITSRGSNGTNQLIRDGAYPVLSAEDILSVLNLDQVPQKAKAQESLPPLTETEDILYRALSTDPMHIDEIIRISRLESYQVSSTLTLLELKGMVREVDTLHYVRA